MDDTGLPGSPNTGVGADQAEGERLGRADGHLHPVHVADPVQDHLDQVEVAHAHARRWSARRRSGRRRPSAAARSRPRRRGRCRGPRPGSRPGAARPSACAGWSRGSGPGAGRRPPRPARRRWRARRRREPAPRPPFPGRRCTARRRGRGRGRCRRRRPPGRPPGPRRPAARARRRSAGADTQTWSPSLRVVSTMATASAPSGKGAPVMIRSASPGPTGARGACPAARVPITVNRDGSAGAGRRPRRRPAPRSRPWRCWGTAARPRRPSPARPAPARRRRRPPPPGPVWAGRRR